MIEVKDVSYTYSDGNQALKSISTSFAQGEISAITGMSGSGKTTLLNCLAGFIIPQQGEILLDAENIQIMDESTFRRRIGVVFQRLNLFPHLTVQENMCLAPLKLGQETKQGVFKQARAMLKRLGIDELSEQYPAQISGGQAQRAAIARGLMLKPKVMLLDEPTSALDAKTSQEFSVWLRELQSDTSFIIVTHDLPFVSITAASGIYMSEGKILKAGSTGDILEYIDQGLENVFD